MADTLKTVSAPKILTAVAFGIAVGAGGVYVANDDGTISPVTVADQVRTDALLEAATKECQDEVALVGEPVHCEWGCKTYRGQDVPPPTTIRKGDSDYIVPADLSKVDQVEGWCCNGAFMPSRVQTCLDDALAKIPKEPKAVVAVEPVELPR